MKERHQRGLQISALCKIERRGDIYLVPSQSKSGKYYEVQVVPYLDCSCPDFKARRGARCKHLYAVEIVIQRESGSAAVQIAEIPIRSKTYTQHWRAYNLAQTTEKSRFRELTYELCSGIDEPIQCAGRNRLPIKDVIFAATYKVYSTTSARRFMTDLREAHDRGYISTPLCYNSINNYLEKEELTPYLKRLITQSSLPLASIESRFAVDASGFSSCQFDRWYNVKYGKEEIKRDWLKAHIAIGVITNVVTAAEVSGPHSADTNHFASLVHETAKYFNVKEVSADKAYSSHANLRLVENLGATPYIDFKSNASGKSRCKVWNKVYLYYNLNRDEFMERYHMRSNVEATFSMIKAKFGGRLRNKLPTAQANEALCKILCHNICCLIQSIYELEIQATFWEATE
jgi:transposase